MKKILFTIISLIAFISFANAEKCSIVSGDGTSVGSEIACGSEHFYIIERDNENTKMLAKYNLYVGLEINQTGPLFDDSFRAAEYCADLEGDFIGNAVWPSLSEPGKYYCHTEKKLSYDKVKQSSEAIGLTMKDGQYVIKQVGIVYMLDFGEIGTFDPETIDNEGNINLRYTEIQGYLDDYKAVLKSEGYNIKDIDLIKLKGFKKLVEKVSGKELNLGTTNDYLINVDPNDEKFPWEIIITTTNPDMLHININDYIPKEYNWIKSTTYWLGSTLFDQNAFPPSGRYAFYDVFMSTPGDLCAMNRGCSTVSKFGAGVRPVVTISNSDIIYKIETKTDGNGTVKSEKVKAAGGEVIKFTVTPNEGYELGVIKVTDDKGNVVYFKDYTFTMPNANVLIEATFVKVNPKTQDLAIGFTIVLFILSLVLILINQRKLKGVIK